MFMDMEGKEDRHNEEKGPGQHLPGILGGEQSRRGKRSSSQPTHLQTWPPRILNKKIWVLIPFYNRCVTFGKSFKLHLGFNPYKVELMISALPPSQGKQGSIKILDVNARWMGAVSIIPG